MRLLIYAITFLFFLGACNEGDYSFTGAVKSIEQGKDGYTAIIINKDGQEAMATISRVDMGAAYRAITVGETVTVYGDTSRLGTGLAIHVSRIGD